jgi:acetyltransferase-like isoleucine patch superfamily enzyme
MMNKFFKYAAAILVPNVITNIRLMIKYHCVVHPGAFVAFPRNLTIGRGTVIGRCEIIAQGPIRIGSDCFINDHVILNSKTGYITIGEHTSINHYSVLFGNGGVEIGAHCAIGLNVQIVKNHIIPPDNSPGYPEVTEGKTTVGDSVWLCSNVVLVDGVTVGSFSVVGSNSLVSRSIPASVVAGGVPARVLCPRQEAV